MCICVCLCVCVCVCVCVYIYIYIYICTAVQFSASRSPGANKWCTVASNIGGSLVWYFAPCHPPSAQNFEMALDFLKTAGHCIHDISGNRFTPKGSCGWHINSSSQWQWWLPSPLLLPY